MGRSVARLSNAQQVFYIETNFNDVELTDEYEVQSQWEDFVEDIKGVLTNAFPSLNEADRYAEREVSIILENKLIEIGIAEYCGLVSVSFRSKEAGYYDKDFSGLANEFINRVTPKAEKLLEENFSTMKRVGGFSDGTSVYEKAS